MGKPSRDKGARTEREVVHRLQEAGLAAERVPLSGASGGSYCGDVSTPFLGADRRLEVKCRAAGFKQIYDWLGDNYALVIKQDRQEPLLVIPLREAVRIGAIAEKARG